MPENLSARWQKLAGRASHARYKHWTGQRIPYLSYFLLCASWWKRHSGAHILPADNWKPAAMRGVSSVRRPAAGLSPQIRHRCDPAYRHPPAATRPVSTGSVTGVPDSCWLDVILDSRQGTLDAFEWLRSMLLDNACHYDGIVWGIVALIAVDFWLPVAVIVSLWKCVWSKNNRDVFQ